MWTTKIGLLELIPLNKGAYTPLELINSIFTPPLPWLLYYRRVIFRHQNKLYHLHTHSICPTIIASNFKISESIEPSHYAEIRARTEFPQRLSHGQIPRILFPQSKLFPFFPIPHIRTSVLLIFYRVVTSQSSQSSPTTKLSANLS